MRRTDADIIDANADMEYLYRVQRRLRQIDLRLKELDAMLDSYGVSSPQIRSTEEAKYQRGTKIYSTDRLMEIFAEQDTLDAERVPLMQAAAHIQTRLVFCQLTDAEQALLDYRYDRRYTYEEIALRMHCQPQTVQYHLDAILKRYVKF